MLCSARSGRLGSFKQRALCLPYCMILITSFMQPSLLDRPCPYLLRYSLFSSVRHFEVKGTTTSLRVTPLYTFPVRKYCKKLHTSPTLLMCNDLTCSMFIFLPFDIDTVKINPCLELIFTTNYILSIQSCD